MYKLQEKKAESREREENFGALQLRVEFSSCCLRVVGHGGKAKRAGRLSRPALLHPFCILDDNRVFFLSLSFSLSLSLEMVDPIVGSCLLPLGKSFAWEEEGGVWRLLMCECEDEKRGTLLFEQPSSPEHRLSDLYSMALPQHTDDILKRATFQRGNGEQTVGIVRGDTGWYISTTMMANF